MAGAGRQILPDGQHVDAVIAHVAHHVENFFVGFAQAHHQAAFGGDVGKLCLEFFQQVQAEGVVSTWARFAVQARNGFQVVVHHIGQTVLQDGERLVVASAEIRHQHLDLRARRQFARFADAVHVVLCAAVAQVIAVNAGDDHVFELERRNGFGQVFRFTGIQRVGPSVPDVAEWAAARAFVAHDHEGGRAVAEAFADIGAGCFFADGNEFVAAQDVLDFVKAAAVAGCLNADPFGFAQRLVWLNPHRDAAELGCGFLLGQRVVVFGGLCFAHHRMAGTGPLLG